MSSHKLPKDREAEQQRWAARQEATAELLRETLDAAGARAAEISEWLESSFLAEEAEASADAPPTASSERPARDSGKDSTVKAGDRPSREDRELHQKSSDREKS